MRLSRSLLLIALTEEAAIAAALDDGLKLPVGLVVPPVSVRKKPQRPCNLMSGNLPLIAGVRGGCGRFSPPRVGD